MFKRAANLFWLKIQHRYRLSLRAVFCLMKERKPLFAAFTSVYLHWKTQVLTGKLTVARTHYSNFEKNYDKEIQWKTKIKTEAIWYFVAGGTTVRSLLPAV